MSLYLIEYIIINHETYVVRKLDSIRTMLKKADVYRMFHDSDMFISSYIFLEREI